MPQTLFEYLFDIGTFEYSIAALPAKTVSVFVIADRHAQSQCDITTMWGSR